MTSSDIRQPPGAEKKRTAWPLFFMAIIFLAPMVAAYFWVPTRFGNYGELVAPPRPITNVSLEKLSGGSMDFSALKTKWILLVLDSGVCTDTCKKTLHAIYQIRQAQAKNSKRIQVVLIVRENNAAIRSFLTKYPGVIGLTGQTKAIQSMFEQYTVNPGDQPWKQPGRIYVVDPTGNFMMYYPENADPNLIWKDLRRLMKVSQVG